MTGRTCGSCTLCCKLLGVQSIKKPRGKWCQHCKGGCQLFSNEARPTECREFSCLWLLATPDVLPEVWSPRRLRAILVQTKDPDTIAIYTDVGFRDRLRDPEIAGVLRAMAKAGKQFVVFEGDRRWLITDAEKVEEGLSFTNQGSSPPLRMKGEELVDAICAAARAPHEPPQGEEDAATCDDMASATQGPQ